MPVWALATPLVSFLILVAAFALSSVGAAMALLCGVALIATVMAAVHHAETVAHKVGEPFGTLVLAIAITVIEVALIVSMMLAGGEGVAALARDTVYSAVMIIVTGVIGICLLVGGLHHKEQSFRVEGANAGLGALIALATLSLILPTFTESAPNGAYTRPQLIFAGVASLVLWAVFVFVQTVRHRDYFLPRVDAANEDQHAEPPTAKRAWASFGLLLVALVTVVGLAKALSPTIENAVVGAGAPRAVIGIAIALLVLLPETWAAIRAARADRLQTSLNLAIGSALASIGLTIPVVGAVSAFLGMRLVLGVEGKDLVLLLLSFMVATVTLAHGRTNVMQGAVHLVIFAAFLFLSLVP